MSPPAKSLLEILQTGAAYLTKRGIEEPRLNMEHLLAHVLGCRRLDLYLRFGETLNEPELSTLRELLRRRGEAEPLQHLLGSVEFQGHDFISDHRALIPRPETDTLCEMVLKKIASHKPQRILDMGTGSGCIGLSLALATGAITVLADVSEDALDLARLNVSRLAPNHPIQTVRSDLCEKISGTFDCVVANLPYIPRAEIATLSREVQRDPLLALDGGPIGTEIVFRFLESLPPFLNEHALIALELAHDQAAAVIEKATALGYRDAHSATDLAGVPRFVFATAPLPKPPEVIET